MLEGKVIQSSTEEDAVKKVDGTPFHVVKTEQGGFVVVMGDNAVSEQFDSIEDALFYISEKPWSLILAAGYIYVEFLNKNKQ